LAPAIPEQIDFRQELRQNQHEIKSCLWDVLPDMFDKLLNGWDRGTSPSSNTTPSRRSRRGLLDVTDSDSAVNSTPLTVPNSVASSRSTELPSSPIAAPRCIAPPSSRVLGRVTFENINQKLDLNAERPSPNPRGTTTGLFKRIEFPAANNVENKDSF
jgi:hypothetical protein